MRSSWALLLVAIVFCVSNRREIRCELTKGCHELYTAGESKYAKTYEPVWMQTCKVLNLGITKITFLYKYPYYFMSANNDTMKLPTGKNFCVGCLDFVDTSITLRSLTVYEDSTLIEIVETWNPSDCIYALVHLRNTSEIGSAKIHAVNCDSDPEIERVVQVITGWTHAYLFYDSTSTGWSFIDQKMHTDRNDFVDINESIEGFVGFNEEGWGSCFGVHDFLFYRIDNGKVNCAFAINAGYYYGMAHINADYHFILRCVSEEISGNADKIHVRSKIEFSLHSKDFENEIPFYSETVQYSLLNDGTGKYTPGKALHGFQTDCYEHIGDITYFAPDDYAMKKLSYLRDHGSTFQRSQLTTFEYDSTAWFR